MIILINGNIVALLLKKMEFEGNVGIKLKVKVFVQANDVGQCTHHGNGVQCSNYAIDRDLLFTSQKYGQCTRKDKIVR